jgi:2-oxoacid:acceptor oxidoreductase gamma subunit (pyruvate/2-ketoisovalerate family)
MREIKFQGRGGQGVVMASQMLGLAFFKAGMYPQCYSLFGGERRGAPVVSFLRVDKEKILLKCDIKQPNELLCFDESLLNLPDVREGMQSGAGVLICTDKRLDAFEDMSGLSVGVIHASAISEKLGLGHVMNTVVLGAYCRLNRELPMERVIEAVMDRVPAKKKENVEAVRQGYENLIM